jgi:hypothetical protein
MSALLFPSIDPPNKSTALTMSAFSLRLGRQLSCSKSDLWFTTVNDSLIGHSGMGLGCVIPADISVGKVTFGIGFARVWT